MKVLNITVYRLKNATHYAFMKMVVELIARFEESLGQFADIIAGLRAAFREEDEAYLKSAKNLITDEIRDWDTKRKRTYMTLKGMVEALEKLPQELTEQAVKPVMQVLKDYRISTAMQYDELYGRIDNLCQDLQERYALECQRLGVEEIVASLKFANDEFQRLLADRTVELSQEQTGVMAAAREKCDEWYDRLATGIDGFIAVYGSERYAPFVLALNKEIDRIRIQVLKNRPGTVDGEEDKDDGATATPPGGGEPSEPGTEPGAGTEPGTEPGAGTEPPSTEPVYATAHFLYFDGEEEEIRALVGSVLVAPQNTEGYHWVPEVPSRMPAVDTSYTEEADGVVKYTVAWYLPNGNPIIWYELAPGEVIPEAPEPPEGYYWHPYPDVMPEHDLDIIPEPIKG